MRDAIEKLIDAAAVVDDASQYVALELADDNDMALADAIDRLREARKAAKASVEAKPTDVMKRLIEVAEQVCIRSDPQSLISAWIRELKEVTAAAKAAMEAKPAKPATRWLNKARIDKFVVHVGRDLETYTTELLDAHDAARQEREESTKPTDAQIVAAIYSLAKLLSGYPTGDKHVALTIEADTKTNVKVNGKVAFWFGQGAVERAVAKLRELSKPKPRTVAETWEDFKAGKLATAKEHNRFREWMAKQDSMVRKVFRLYMESADATAKELLDAWMAENGNVPIETQDKEN